MPLKARVLFDQPQLAIASVINQKLASSSRTQIVTGFATPGGVDTLAAAIRPRPQTIDTFVVGAATYPGYEAVERLISLGVPLDRIRVHLGHTRPSGTTKNPYVRFHPMLHSKIYYTEHSGGVASVILGSHNVTSFALAGLNGEAAVLLEGPVHDPELDRVRRHIFAARQQAVPYRPSMKEAFAWWTREFLDGMRAEMKLPNEWTTVRTIIVFAQAPATPRPAIGEHMYFEIPAGIEQIENLKTETHHFLFETLPPNPWDALALAMQSDARYTCTTLGAENKQGNREVKAHWRIDGARTPVLATVNSTIFRPTTPSGMQQVRAEIVDSDVVPFDYLFDRNKAEWDPELSNEDAIRPVEMPREGLATIEAVGERRPSDGWMAVQGLRPRSRPTGEKDQAALELASPDSGAFILISLRRAKKDRPRQPGEEK